MEKSPLAASLLILWLHLSRVCSVLDVNQYPLSLHVHEGENTNFTCHFPTSSFYGLQWYRWEPAKSPKFLFTIALNGDEKEEGRVKVTLDTKKGSSSLYIKGSQPEDAATYLCALTDTVLSRHLQPIPKPVAGAALVSALTSAMCRVEKANSLSYSVFNNQRKVMTQINKPSSDCSSLN
uniref:Ig-like domain-containing protein n=1 Tax=Lynx canadensis TaxID=61383 RepID=A0A667FYC7_LYNCA